LDQALKEHIIRDKSENSTRLLLEKHLKKEMDWKNRIYPLTKKRITGSHSKGKTTKI